MMNVSQWINAIAGKFDLQISRPSSLRDRLPVEASAEDASALASVRPFTMTSNERLWSLMNAVRYVLHEGIDGDFVECGVWRGGSVMAMANELLRLGTTSRHIWLYDTFRGMTDPSDRDVEEGTGRTAEEMLSVTAAGDGNNVWCIAGREDVERNVLSTGYPSDKFVFIEGDVCVTAPLKKPESIGILRLDTDWYESTRACLDHLYPLVSLGGVCILDDYGHWKGAREAVDEYFAERSMKPLMHPIDYSGRIFVKTAALK